MRQGRALAWIQCVAVRGGTGVMPRLPLEDEDGCDARRSEAGRPSMADYRKMMRELYRQPVE